MVYSKSALLPDLAGCPIEAVSPTLAAAVAPVSRDIANRAPNATITLKPMENSKLVYLPLAPKFEGAKAQVKLVLACLITNNEITNLALSNVTFTFPGSSVPAKNMQGENLVPPIKPGESAW